MEQGLLFVLNTKLWPQKCGLTKQKEVYVIAENKKQKMKQSFPIYNQKLAGFLMLQGYRLMGIEENETCKGKNVFYFMDSEKIRKSIQIYFGNTK